MDSTEGGSLIGSEMTGDDDDGVDDEEPPCDGDTENPSLPPVQEEKQHEEPNQKSPIVSHS